MYLVDHLTRVGVLLLAASLIFTTGFLVYQLFFHPLAKYPGPLLAKFTNGYAAYHAWKGDIHVDMWRCHRKYGTSLRYAPNRLLVNSAAGIQDIYGHGSNVQKSSVYHALVHRAPNTLTIINKVQHSRKRRVISQAFSDSSLRLFEPAILAQIDKFIAYLNKHIGANPDGESWSEELNVAPLCDFLAFDIMADVVFSSNIDMLGCGKSRGVFKAIEDSNVRMSVLVQAPEVASWKFHKKFFPVAIRARNEFIAFVSKMLQDRLLLKPDEGGRKDIFSFLAGTKDPLTGEKLGINELGAESTTLIVAGSDTTSTTMAGIFYYLTRYPSVLKKVQSEVRSCFSSAAELRLGPQLNSCTYLQACVTETLRLSPSVGASLWREVRPGGACIGGHYIPAGCDVGVGIYSIHHEEHIYPDPFTFKPERWSARQNDNNESTKTALDGSPHSGLTPFSIGPRSCIGKGLAMAELMLTMASVVYAFDFRVGGDDDLAGIGRGECVQEYLLRDHITASKDDVFIQLRRRC